MRSKSFRTILSVFPALALAFCFTVIQAGSARAQAGDGYIDLLAKNSDGKYTKHGWNHYGPGYFTLDDSTGELTSHNGMGLFWYSAKMFKDFVLELDFNCDEKDTNSGIFLRIPNVPVSDDYIYASFEIQILDYYPADTSMKHLTGAIYDAEPPKKLTSKEPGQWNQFKITCQGMDVTVELNGEVVTQWQFKPSGKVATCWPMGYIGLQNHDRTPSVHFRNIRVKEL